MKKFLAAIGAFLTTMFIFSIAIIAAGPAAEGVFDGGSGTEDDPYLISTENQLRSVADYPDAAFLQTTSITLTSSWKPIRDFSGIYDGDGYSIDNLTSFEYNGSNIGLFAENYGTIRNLIIYGANSDIMTLNTQYAGMMVGWNYGLIEQCGVYGILRGPYAYTGLFVGYNGSGDADNPAIIADCYAVGHTRGTRWNKRGGFAYEPSFTGSIQRCYYVGLPCGNLPTVDVVGNNPSYQDILNYFMGDYWNTPVGFDFMQDSNNISCYYDSDRAGLTNYVNPITDRRDDRTAIARGDATPRTSAQMKALAPANWDFNYTWCRISGENEDYPFLRCMKLWNMNLRLGEVSAAPGAQVSIPVIAEDNGVGQVFSFYELKFRFDSSRLTPVAVKNGSAVGDAGNLTAKIDENGDYVVSFNSSKNISADGELLVLTFKVAPEAAVGRIPIKMIYSYELFGDTADNAVLFDIHNGGVRVEGTSGPEPEIIPVTCVKLSETKLDMKPGETATLTAEVMPENATNKNVVWTTTNPSVATVNEGVVSAIAEGEAQITAAAEDGGSSGVCNVTVALAPTPPSEQGINWSIDNNTLFINGSGPMDDYKYGDVPWADCGESITRVVVGEGVTSIGSGAFDYIFENLVEVNLPSTIERIGERAFFGTAIKEIELPENLKTIESEAFSYCENLAGIVIPAKVEQIDVSVFYGCLSLEKIEVDQRNGSYKSVDGVLFSGDGKVLLAYPCGSDRTTYKIPDGTRTIEFDAFSWSTLENVDMPDGLEIIKNYAFDKAMNLVSVRLPSTLAEIYSESFISCTSLTDIFVDGDNAHFADLDGVLFSADMTELIKYPEGRTATSYMVPDGVVAIDYDALDSKFLTEIYVPVSTTAIDSYAFGYSTGKLTLVGEAGSFVESFAEKKGINFRIADGGKQKPEILSFDISEVGGMSLVTVETANMPDSARVIAAGYRGDGLMLEAATAEESGMAILKAHDIDYIRVFAWDGSTMSPLCEQKYAELQG